MNALFEKLLAGQGAVVHLFFFCLGLSPVPRATLTGAPSHSCPGSRVREESHVQEGKLSFFFACLFFFFSLFFPFFLFFPFGLSGARAGRAGCAGAGVGSFARVEVSDVLLF